MATVMIALLASLWLADRAIGLVHGPVVRPVNQLGMEGAPNEVGTLLRPGFTGAYATMEYSTRVRVNSLGLRGGETALRKPDGTFRILALGDSFTFGQGVEEWQTWPSVLQERASAANGHLDVINGGFTGLSPSGYLRYLRVRGLQLDPDLVIVQVFVGNDVVDELLDEDASLTGAERIAFESHYLAGLPLAAVGRSREQGPLGAVRRTVDDLVPNLYDLVTLSVVKTQYMLGAHRMQFDYILAEETPDLEHGWQRLLAALEATVRLAEGDGRRAIAIVIPFYDQVAPSSIQAGLERDRPQRRIMAFCGAQRLTCIDLLPALRAAGDPRELYYLQDGHLTPRGQETVAIAVLDRLKREGLIPGK